MSNIAIKVENLSKYYKLGVIGSGTLRDDLVRWWAKYRGKVDPLSRLDARRHHHDKSDQIWALKNVDLQVKRGEVLGIIGPNGAGKSTLLKILSSITSPTEGRVYLGGRVASLLEVGTGMHPELTGLENIFLNGAILGMTKTEIQNRLESIIEFSGISEFIETPVKRYSSGMRVRLAFAVAAHLDPEILIVDEVLAVGDASFQKKCLGKMHEASQSGRTVLLVSHQMAAIQSLCDRVILFDCGEIAAEGSPKEVTDIYLAKTREKTYLALSDRRDREGNRDIEFTDFKLHDINGMEVKIARTGRPINFLIRFKKNILKPIADLFIGIGIDNQNGDRVTLISNGMTGEELSCCADGNNIVLVKIDKFPLNTGRYSFTLYARANGLTADWIKNAGSFDVEADDFYGSGKLPSINQGNFLMDCSFSIPENFSTL